MLPTDTARPTCLHCAVSSFISRKSIATTPRSGCSTSQLLFSSWDFCSALSVLAPLFFVFERALSRSGACRIISVVLIIIFKTVPLREGTFHAPGVSSIRVLASIVGSLRGGALSDSRLTWSRYLFPTLVADTYIDTIVEVVLYQLALRSRRRISIFLLYRPSLKKHRRITTIQESQNINPIELVLFVSSMV